MHARKKDSMSLTIIARIAYLVNSRSSSPLSPRCSPRLSEECSAREVRGWLHDAELFTNFCSPPNLPTKHCRTKVLLPCKALKYTLMHVNGVLNIATSGAIWNLLSAEDIFSVALLYGQAAHHAVLSGIPWCVFYSIVRCVFRKEARRIQRWCL